MGLANFIKSMVSLGGHRRPTTKANFSILEVFDGKALERGFEVQTPGKAFIDWNTPLGELISLPFVEKLLHENGSQTVRFAYPIRVGRLLLEDLENTVSRSSRLDLPPLSLRSKLYSARRRHDSYFSAKTCLAGMCGPTVTCFERLDQNYASFETCGIGFTVTYWHHTDHWNESRFTELTIENRREYPTALDITEYERCMRPDGVVPIGGKQTRLVTSYRWNSRIKRCPTSLAKDVAESAIFWVDRTNHLIGFAVGSYCELIPLEMVSAIELTNILPARGPGSSTLDVILHERAQPEWILAGECHAFDASADAIGRLAGVAGVPVVWGPEYRDD